MTPRVFAAARATASPLAALLLPAGRSSACSGYPRSAGGACVQLSELMRRDALIALSALGVGAGAAYLVVGGDREPSPAAASAALALLVGWAYIGSGLVARRHRPENRLGWVMVFIGFAWFATFLADANASLAFTLGTALEDVYLIAFVYLVLSFPTGRLRGKLDRALVASAVVVGTVVELAWLLFADSHAVICADCPANSFELVRNDRLANGLLQGQRVVGLVLSLFTLALLVARWRRASPAQRRAVAPVLWTGGAMFGALALSIVNDILDEPLGPGPSWTRSCVFAAIPIAVLAVLLQRRLARGAVAGLVVELGKNAAAVDLREALGRALGDPSLELAYWIPARARYVGADGSPVRLPEPHDERVSTIVEREGEPIAALVHDAALRENVELMDSVCAAAALTLENERLRAELLAKLAELQASRARLVEATESERRRIERDLHDGTQQRLVSLAMTIGLAESKLAKDPGAVGPVLREAKEALTLALEELRELSQGIHPAILVERGLAAAIEDLARRAALPVRLNLAVEGPMAEQVEAAAYFVASEALTNAAKHSHASEVRLSVARDGETLVVQVSDDGIGGAGPSAGGSGLRGLADRIEAVGGRFTVSSPPGRGTTLRAEIPCA
jgi:signal transduction histidine kinase